MLSPSAGLPEISVPIGLHSDGCGIGMEIAATKDSEQLLLNIAYSYTENYSHRVVPTGAPDEYKQYNRGSVEKLLSEREDFENKKEEEGLSSSKPSSANGIPKTNLDTIKTVAIAVWAVAVVLIAVALLIAFSGKVKKK